MSLMDLVYSETSGICGRLLPFSSVVPFSISVSSQTLFEFVLDDRSSDSRREGVRFASQAAKSG